MCAEPEVKVEFTFFVRTPGCCWISWHTVQAFFGLTDIVCRSSLSGAYEKDESKTERLKRKLLAH